MKKFERRPLRSYWQPRYWPTWLAIGFLRATCMLPYPWQMRLGKAIGRLGHRIAGSRRAIARRNIEICFPELSAEERDRLALEHFEALGCSLMEWALGRWASADKLRPLTRITGVENIEKAFEAGHNVILISAHFTALEVTGRIFREVAPAFDAVFRPFRNPMLTELITSGREIAARKVIEKNDIKSMVRSLREGICVWYAPDQAYSLKQSALLDFFGEPAMTNTATTTLAKLGKAIAIPYIPRRLPEGGYLIEVLPPIDGLPSDDPEEDTRRYLAVLEEQIRKCPEQYYWVHKRFKNRPAPLPDAYADLDSLK
jgi:KDO2-lipid IV(A) lauroyltransferase